MPTIVYIEAGGAEHVVDASAGQTLCQAALNHAVPGILGDCGGNGTCGTCHAYVERAWDAALPAPGELELGMLDGVLEPADNSRLLCQIEVSEALEGLRVRLPASQF